MKSRIKSRWIALAALASVAFVPAGESAYASAPPQGEATATYSGRAFVAELTLGVLPTPIYIADTGEMPPSGGCIEAAQLDYSLVGSLDAEVLTSQVDAASGFVSSSAACSNVFLLGGLVRSSFVRAESNVNCRRMSGSVEITDLVVANQTIDIPLGGFPPNTVLLLPGGGKLFINEQVTTIQGAHRELLVNALRVWLPLVDITVLSARSGIDCVGPAALGPCHDFTSGGGFIDVGGGHKANFGFTVGFKQSATVPSGSFNYVDHSEGLHIKSTGVTSYHQGATPQSRHFEGTAEVNGQGGFTYSVDVADNGEPGKGVDTFQISLSSGYSAGGLLAGGNIQIHKPCP